MMPGGGCLRVQGVSVRLGSTRTPALPLPGGGSRGLPAAFPPERAAT